MPTPPLATLSHDLNHHAHRTCACIQYATYQVHHLHREMPRQTLPFPGARCAAAGGDFFLVASGDEVYALLPPAEPAACCTTGSSASASASTAAEERDMPMAST